MCVVSSSKVWVVVAVAAEVVAVVVAVVVIAVVVAEVVVGNMLPLSLFSSISRLSSLHGLIPQHSGDVNMSTRSEVALSQATFSGSTPIAVHLSLAPTSMDDTMKFIAASFG